MLGLLFFKPGPLSFRRHHAASPIDDSPRARARPCWKAGYEASTNQSEEGTPGRASGVARQSASGDAQARRRERPFLGCTIPAKHFHHQILFAIASSKYLDAGGSCVRCLPARRVPRSKFPRRAEARWLRRLAGNAGVRGLSRRAPVGAYRQSQRHRKFDPTCALVHDAAVRRRAWLPARPWARRPWSRSRDPDLGRGRTRCRCTLGARGRLALPGPVASRGRIEWGRPHCLPPIEPRCRARTDTRAVTDIAGTRASTVSRHAPAASMPTELTPSARSTGTWFAAHPADAGALPPSAVRGRDNFLGSRVVQCHVSFPYGSQNG